MNDLIPMPDEIVDPLERFGGQLVAQRSKRRPRARPFPTSPQTRKQ